MGKLVKVCGNDATPILLILLSLPFIQPVQIPGFSTPFGLLLALLGVQIVYGKAFLIPQWLARRTIAAKHLKMIVNAMGKFIDLLQRFVRPERGVVWCTGIWRRGHGVFIVILALTLALPLPLPLSNIIVAWGILAIGIGLLFKDALWVSLGYGFLLLTILYFYLIGGSVVFLFQMAFA